MSLFNPWVLLGLMLTLLSTFGGGYFKGKHDENSRQQIEIAAANQIAREKEQALVAAVNAQAGQLVKVNQNAKIEIAKRDAAIASGAIKLRLPVKAPECSLSTTTDAESSSRPDTRTAEIQPETSRAILAIGDEADTTVRKLNACLAIYNQTREMINERK